MACTCSSCASLHPNVSTDTLYGMLARSQGSLRADGYAATASDSSCQSAPSPHTSTKPRTSVARAASAGTTASFGNRRPQSGLNGSPPNGWRHATPSLSATPSASSEPSTSASRKSRRRWTKKHRSHTAPLFASRSLSRPPPPPMPSMPRRPPMPRHGSASAWENGPPCNAGACGGAATDAADAAAAPLYGSSGARCGGSGPYAATADGGGGAAAAASIRSPRGSFRERRVLSALTSGLLFLRPIGRRGRAPEEGVSGAVTGCARKGSS
mmetsp:Transcript_38736/g.115114  ORF Transcript_38736/g.115114 Transcript_38736/m.115114 type:complete len:269 (-) Transcript_38736:13-819(-)